MSELWRVQAAPDEGRDSFLGASEIRSLEPASRRRIAALRANIQHMMDAEIAADVAQAQFRTPAPREAGRAISTMCTSLPVVSGEWAR